MHERADGLDVDRLAHSDHQTQCIGHRVLAFTGGKLQDLHVLFVSRRFGVGLAKRGVSEPERAGGKHLFAVAIVGEGPRLADQGIDHMTVIDRRSLLSIQPWHRLNVVTLMRHFDLFGSDPHVHFGPHQAAGNRVGVFAHLNRAALTDPEAAEHVVSIQPAVR